ncbi:MAG: hypothetical protein IT201_14560 [Thermoleophilia bacterium]|nr:hypothetical protein [Thermoleophilia bacterium]
MATSNGTQLEAYAGVVDRVNDNGFTLAGYRAWINYSTYRPIPDDQRPEQGDQVRVTVKTDARGRFWIEELSIEKRADPNATPAQRHDEMIRSIADSVPPPRDPDPLELEPPAASASEQLTARAAALASAVSLTAPWYAGPERKPIADEVLRLAEKFERWLTR